MPESDTHDNVAAALLEVAKVRYAAFRERISAWSRISLQAVLEAREG